MQIKSLTFDLHDFFNLSYHTFRAFQLSLLLCLYVGCGSDSPCFVFVCSKSVFKKLLRVW